MPYPVSPPAPPAIIDVVPGEFSDAALAAPASEPSPELAPAQPPPSSASIDLQILDSQLPEASSAALTPAPRNDISPNNISPNTAGSLGAPVEIDVPMAWSETSVPATSPTQLPTPASLHSTELDVSPFSAIRSINQSHQAEFTASVPASRLPELSDASIPAQEPVTQESITQQSAAQQSVTQESAAQDTTQQQPGNAPNSVAPSQPPQDSQQSPTPTPSSGQTGQRTPATPGTTAPGTAEQPAAEDVLELNADRQEYDERNRVFQAEGNVELRFRGARLTSTRLLVNIPNRIAVAEGDAVLTRGAQVLRGDRIEYNLVQNQGNILGARGELSLSSISEDTAPTPPPPSTPPGTPPGTRPGTPPGTRPGTTLPADQPAVDQALQVFGSTSELTFGANSPGQRGGAAGARGQGIQRLRYEADQIQFSGPVWQATNVRITNDPFSPPELELRSSRVTVTPLGPGRTEIRARNPRLVFDQGFSLPLLQNRFIIDNRERNPGLLSFGFDEEDRGGFFVERAFDFTVGGVALLTLTPQILVQRAIDEGFGASSFGLIARLRVDPTPTTSIRGNATLTTFDFDDFEDTFRGSFRAQQVVLRHTVALEYSYRDRLYNGSLGFQDVRSSIGLVVTSPTYILGNTGFNLTYQAGAQYINSDANVERYVNRDPDIFDLLNFNEDGSLDNIRIDLARYQVAASLNRIFILWYGDPLPATADQGLRYTSNPIIPYVGLFTGLRGVFSAYSNGDTQSVLTPTIGFSAQFGHFSRPFLDYTGFTIAYSYNAVGGETPFNFDRVNDIQTLTVGLNQQIYGPFRFGVRSTFYLESKANREDDADTTFTLEYSRRTYSITLSYSPQRQSGAIGVRISDFNWVGDPGPFTGLGAANVSGGVTIPGD